MYYRRHHSSPDFVWNSISIKVPMNKLQLHNFVQVYRGFSTICNGSEDDGTFILFFVEG